ncbi:MAG: acetylornithine deacetylase [Kiloniellales bacterium]
MAKTESVALIEKLIAFETISMTPNLDLIEFVRGYLEQLGVRSELVFSEDRQQANLYATVGPENTPGVMLSGHSDVVPVKGQAWDSDPFKVRESDGRLYGRGTCDMKSFIAVVLAHVPLMLERGLKTPVHLAFSYDEEIGCVGVRRLIAMLKDLPVRPAMCVVGEPTGMKVIVAHKGKRALRVRARGLECHSSLPTAGVNAIDYAAELIGFIRTLAGRAAEQGPFDPEFEVAYTTLHTGTVRGGTALNIVPKDCAFEFEIRNLPDEDPEALVDEIKEYARERLEPEMQAVDPAAGFDFEDLSGYPGLDTDPGAEVVRFVQSLAGANDHGKMAFGTEAGLFHRRVDVPTVVCGPGFIEQAHKPNEFIALEQVALCETFMERLIDRLSA